MGRDPMVRRARWVLFGWILALAIVALHTHDDCDDHDGDGGHSECSICAVAQAPATHSVEPLALEVASAPILVALTHRPTPPPARVVFRVTARGPPASV